MSKTLELNFDAELGSAKISVRNPKENLTPAEIKAAMEKIVQANVFNTTNGDLVRAVNARVIDRTTADIELP